MKPFIIFSLLLPLATIAQLDNVNDSALDTVKRSRQTRKSLSEADNVRNPASIKSEFEDFEKLMKDDNSWEEELNQILEN